MRSRRVALIRGINVGRAKRVSMADLRALIDGLGFHECRTLLDSGNIVFSGGGGRSTSIADRIEKAMLTELGIAARDRAGRPGVLNGRPRESSAADGQ